MTEHLVKLRHGPATGIHGVFQLCFIYLTRKILKPERKNYFLKVVSKTIKKNDMKKTVRLILILTYMGSTIVNAQIKNELKVKGTGFEMNGMPFEYTGVSFFNALYNKEFNQNSEKRRGYIRKFNEYGINVLRVWCQWDNGRGFADSESESTLYTTEGSLKPDVLATLKSLCVDANEEGTIILLVLFSRENINEGVNLSDEAKEKAMKSLANEMKPYRNLVFQIWNEYNYRTVDYYKLLKSIDSSRLVTNSPGFAGELGSIPENRHLDYLSPHTSRNDSRHWEIVGEEIKYLIVKYNKPVVDDEPARIGTPKFGGPTTPTFYTDHILNIYNVWKAGGYVIYHHDMFQTGYGTPAVPENGIPLPGFSNYHDQVFEFLKNKERYLKHIKTYK
jgi:hypothetical protein